MCMCAESVLSLGVCENRDGWLAAWGFLWVTGCSFFHCVASPFHSFVTTMCMCRCNRATLCSHM